MKRKPLILSIALLFVVGAALWGVNYRLDHPPLTKADKELRALLAGADSMRASQASCQNAPCLGGSKRVEFGPLNAQQTREIINNIRLLDKEISPSQVKPAFINLLFFKNGKSIHNVILFQEPNSTEVIKNWDGKKGNQNQFLQTHYKLNPRFNKQLNRVLDAYLPQRIRP